MQQHSARKSAAGDQVSLIWEDPVADLVPAAQEDRESHVDFSRVIQRRTCGNRCIPPRPRSPRGLRIPNEKVLSAWVAGVTLLNLADCKPIALALDRLRIHPQNGDPLRVDLNHRNDVVVRTAAGSGQG